MDFFKILNGGIGVSMSNFDRLWAKKFSGWPETELTGLLPLSFLSKGEALTDYRIYGTENGAGVQTENLFDKDAKDTEKGYVNSKYFNSSGEIVAGVYNISEYIKVEPNQNYTIYYGAATTTPALCLYDAEKTRVSIISYNASPMVITTTIETMYMRISVKTNAWNSAYVVKGSTAPTTYIPFGYIIPLVNTSGVTENLCSETLSNLNINSNGAIYNENNYSLAIFEVTQNETYTLVSSQVVCAFYTNKPSRGDVSYNEARTIAQSEPYTVISPITGWCAIRYSNSDNNPAMAVSGSTPPDHYIPHRYETSYNLYIGDSKLGEEEYLDYGEQKVYRFYSELTLKGDEENLYYYGTYEGVQTFYLELPNNVKYIAATDAPHLHCNYYSATYKISPTVSKTCRYRQTTNESQIVWDLSRIYMFDDDYTNLSDFKAHLAELYNNDAPLKISYLSKNAPIPTDPPLSFPALSTYKGENTLSSEETVGEVTIKGKIKEAP